MASLGLGFLPEEMEMGWEPETPGFLPLGRAVAEHALWLVPSSNPTPTLVCVWP